MTDSEFPKTVAIKSGDVHLRSIAQDDGEAILAFAKALPAHDLLYLRRDITKMPVVEAWLQNAKDGESLSLMAERDGVLIGTSALMIDQKSWSPHVGEIRVLISEGERGQGLGRVMIQETFALAVANGIEKIIAQMTLDQTGARAVFEELGFQQEALLKEHVRDRTGEDHDIIIMSCNVAVAAARLGAFR